MPRVLLRGDEMGTWTIIKLLAALAIAFGTGGAVFSYIGEYRHRGQVIEAQKIEIGNLKIEKENLAKKERAEKKVATRGKAINEQEIRDEKAIDEALAARDATRIVDLFKPYGVRKDSDGLHDAANGQGGRARPSPK
jgi:hypothetical protein